MDLAEVVARTIDANYSININLESGSLGAKLVEAGFLKGEELANIMGKDDAVALLFNRHIKTKPKKFTTDFLRVLRECGQGDAADTLRQTFDTLIRQNSVSSATVQPVGRQIGEIYIPREELERNIKKKVSKMEPGYSLLVWGEGGVGKTTLLRRLLKDKKFLRENKVQLGAWLNCTIISENYDEDRFFAELAVALNIDDKTASPWKVKVANFVRETQRKGGKVLIVLDDVFNERIFKAINSLEDSCCPRTICVSRNNYFSMNTTLPIYTKVFNVPRLPENGIKNIFDECFGKEPWLDDLVGISQGLPLVAQVVNRELLARKDSPELLKSYVREIRSKCQAVFDKTISYADKEGLIQDILLMGFNEADPGFQRRYSAFLFFAEGETVEIIYLEALWQCTRTEAVRFCREFEDASLLRSLEVDKKYNIHAYLFYALLKKFCQDEARDLNGFRLDFLLSADHDEIEGNILHSVFDISWCLFFTHLRDTVTDLLKGDSSLSTCLAKLTSHRRKKDNRTPVELLAEINDSDDLCWDAYQWRQFHLIHSRPTSAMDDLMSAAARGDTERVRELITPSNELLEAQDEINMTALMWAARYNQVGVVKLLLDRGADVNSANRMGKYTALEWAAYYNNVNAAALILDCVIDLNSKMVWQAIEQAVCQSNNDIINLLLDRGANPNSGDITALMTAAWYNRVGIINLLLDRNVDIDFKSNSYLANYVGCRFYVKGWTALSLGAAKNHAEAVHVLLDRGADVNSICDSGENALIVAAGCNAADVVKVLLARGADVNSKCKSNWTSLIHAAERNSVAIVQMLLDHGADVDAPSERGTTALIEAADKGHTAVVKILLERGADFTKKMRSGSTILRWAVLHNHLDVIRALLNRGVGADHEQVREAYQFAASLKQDSAAALLKPYRSQCHVL